MKYIVAGGRDYTGKYQMSSVLRRVLVPSDSIISGCAKGADSLAIEWAAHHNVECLQMPADWDKHGKSAGAIRNQQMALAADGLVAFWDGVSPGTKDMITKAINYGLEVHVYRYGDRHGPKSES